MLSNSKANSSSLTARFKLSTSRLTISLTLAMTSMAISPFWLTGAAHADCSPTAGNNVVAVCDGQTVNQGGGLAGSAAGTDGYGTGTESGMTIDVTESASVVGDTNGIFTETDLHVVNAGHIQGNGSAGVRSSQNLELLENNGTIQGSTNAVASVLDIGSIINTGRIVAGTGGGAGAAVTSSSGSIGTLTNSGTMTGATDGVFASQNIGSLTNFGFITSDGVGVRANSGAIAALFNSGTISGGSDDGIIASTRIASIINSGTIRGGTFAIQEQGAGNTNLTLNAGSVLMGRVDLGGGVNTLNIGEGLSLNSTFEAPDANSNVPVLELLNGHLIAFADTTVGAATSRQVVAVDLSAFASFDDALAALTSGFGGAVQSRQAAVRSDPALGFASRFAAADETSLAAFSDLDDAPHLNPNRFWIEGFGSFRQGESDRIGGNFDSLTGGLVAGVDVPLDALSSIGVMAGFAASTSENEIDTQTTDATSYFGGIYASTQAGGIYWDASLTLGYTDYDAERITANNLVANGLETARADFGGWFINPQVTMTREAANPLAGSGIGALMATNTLEQILTLSYAGLFMDGYTETGTTNPLTLDDRSVHVASARAALALPFEAIHANGALTTLRLIGGVEAHTQFGDDTVSGILLGQAVSTTLDGDDFTGGAFLGLSGEYETTTGLTAYANVEAMLETDMAYQISANAGLRIAF